MQRWLYRKSSAAYLAANSHVLRGKHGCVGRGLVTVGLDLHAAGDAAQCLLARQISNVDKGVVEAGKDVSHAEDVLALTHGGAHGHLGDDKKHMGAQRGSSMSSRDG
jgi:hypothetical protein